MMCAITSKNFQENYIIFFTLHELLRKFSLLITQYLELLPRVLPGTRNFKNLTFVYIKNSCYIHAEDFKPFYRPLISFGWFQAFFKDLKSFSGAPIISFRGLQALCRGLQAL